MSPKGLSLRTTSDRLNAARSHVFPERESHTCFMTQDFIYLDNNATSRIHPAALEAMLPYLDQYYGNPASINHSFGKKAAAAVEQARKEVAERLQAGAEEITFTSGATEAINLAIKGVFSRYRSLGNHIITCKTEHKAVLDTCAYLEKKGAQVTYLSVNERGEICLEELEEALRKETILLCFMHGNNETGILHPISQIAKIAQENQILYLCDATQTIGKIPLSVQNTPIDLLACSAHKMHGPKGAGLLYCRRKSRRIQLDPILHGGRQEHSLRAGTLNVPAIVGFGAAARLAEPGLYAAGGPIAHLRGRLEDALLALPETFLNGKGGTRMTQVTNIGFRHITAAQLMKKIHTLAFSSGSACSTGSLDPSHVLLAMGLSKEDAHASIRLSLSRYTTPEEVQKAIYLLEGALRELREESPVWMLHQKGLL